MISFSLVTRHFGACHALPRFLGVRRTSLRREFARHGPRRPASRRGIRLDGQRLGVFAASPRRRGRPGNDDDDDGRSFSLRRTARRVSIAFFLARVELLCLISLLKLLISFFLRFIAVLVAFLQGRKCSTSGWRPKRNAHYDA